MRDAPFVCPFHAEAYLAAFPHVGAVDARPGAPAPVLRRPIPGADGADGFGPWPYAWIRDDADIAALARAFENLVTLTLLTPPGHLPPVRWPAAPLKQHFLHDPDLPAPAPGPRTRDHLRRGARRASFEIVEAVEDRMALADLYVTVQRRRGLRGLLDFPRRHFEILARLPGMVFFGARGVAGFGGMTCGALFDGRLQLLHIAASEAGMRDDVTYVLMAGVVDYCRRQGLLLMLGGAPSSDGAGIGRFKARWSNRQEPVHIVKIVNQPETYAALCRGRADTGFFPAYRSMA